MSEFDQPLVLTTPHIKSDAVKDAQWLLAGHSRFPDLQTYKDGPLDGDYGSQSATATERAWYWIGAPAAKQRPVFTQELYEYLRPNKWRPLPVSWRKARDARIAAAAETPGRKALELAATFIGYHEGPRATTRRSSAPGTASTTSRGARSSRATASPTPATPPTATPPSRPIYYDARAGRNGLRIVTTPQPATSLLQPPRRPVRAHRLLRPPPERPPVRRPQREHVERRLRERRLRRTPHPRDEHRHRVRQGDVTCRRGRHA
jgi:hypothetical protein